jgi:hypothetical protein
MQRALAFTLSIIASLASPAMAQTDTQPSTGELLASIQRQLPAFAEQLNLPENRITNSTKFRIGMITYDLTFNSYTNEGRQICTFFQTHAETGDEVAFADFHCDGELDVLVYDTAAMASRQPRESDQFAYDNLVAVWEMGATTLPALTGFGEDWSGPDFTRAAARLGAERAARELIDQLRAERREAYVFEFEVSGGTFVSLLVGQENGLFITQFIDARRWLQFEHTYGNVAPTMVRGAERDSARVEFPPLRFLSARSEAAQEWAQTYLGLADFLAGIDERLQPLP